MATVTINIPSQLPALTGNSLLYLRVNLAESGIEWAATAGGGITIGTTAIASGTVNRILFEGSGNVVQQDADFVWNNTDKRLILGTESSPDANARLVVIGKNTGATVGFAVHNSTGNNNALVVRDDGRVLVNSSTLAFSGTNNTRLQVGTNNGVTHSADIVSSATAGGTATFLRLRNSGASKTIQFDNGSGGINCFFNHTNSSLNRIDLINQSGNTEQIFVVRDGNSSGEVGLAGGNTKARLTLTRSGTISIGLYDNNSNDSFWNPTGTRTFIFGGTTRTNASALVEMTSTTRGFLPPRMTAAERAAISSPANGLCVIQTDGGAGVEGLYRYETSSGTWVRIG